MLKSALLAVFAALCLVPAIRPAKADDLPCVSTTFRFIGKNDRVCISAFDDPKVPRTARQQCCASWPRSRPTYASRVACWRSPMRCRA